MSITIHSAEVLGIDGVPIDVEVDITPGLHKFMIVGLADKAVDESRERISAAIKNIGAKPPHKKNARIVISLAPADIKKEGPVFDLAIALGYMLASGQTEFSPRKKLFLGELALDGSLRPIRGALSLALAAREKGFEELFLPARVAREAALVSGVSVFGCDTLEQVLRHLEGKECLVPLPETHITEHDAVAHALDFADVKGQESAKRGLEIAAAGGHNIALSGPPGTGKTLLSRALVSILPPPDLSEVIEITRIQSIAGTLSENTITRTRPFRSPHHTSSHIALVGGGSFPRPGEITLAHRGVLFLDEFPEFDRRVIEALRQPLEDGVISISRARGSLTYPARITLVAAMNPCPCGNNGNPVKECVCPPNAIERYERRISGPIMDRIDICIAVPPVDHKALGDIAKGEPSSAVRERVTRARAAQRARFAGTPLVTNSEMGVKEIEKWCELAPSVKSILATAAKNLELSARVYHRTIKIARTIADLAGAEDITQDHILEGLQYRPKTKN